MKTRIGLAAVTIVLAVFAAQVFSVATAENPFSAELRRRACSDFRAALLAHESAADEATWEALLDASEAVNRAISDDAAGDALSQIWNLRRVRSLATIALGMWAYGPGPKAHPSIRDDVAKLHQRGQQLAWELQAIYYEAVRLACIQNAP